MKRNQRFALRVSAEERRIIENLSQKLQRTQSDAIRWSIRKVAREMGMEDRDEVTKNRRVSE